MGLLYDTFENLLAGLGVVGRDKVMSQRAILNEITYDMRTLEALYRSDWLSRKIVDVPAFDACRAWRSWQAEQDQIEQLEAAERSFGLQKKLLEAMTKARLYGGAAMVHGVKGTPFNEELDLDDVKKGDLKFIPHVVEKWMIQAGPRVRDIASPWFRSSPEYYLRSSTPIVGAPGNVTPLKPAEGFDPKQIGSAIYIHPSRVVPPYRSRLSGYRARPSAWGDSVLQPVHDAIRDAGLVAQSLSFSVADSKVDVFKIPGLAATLSTTDGTDQDPEVPQGGKRRQVDGRALLIDKEMEWDRIQTKFEGLPQVLQAYLTVASGAADIPADTLASPGMSRQV